MQINYYLLKETVHLYLISCTLKLKNKACIDLKKYNGMSSRHPN